MKSIFRCGLLFIGLTLSLSLQLSTSGRDASDFEPEVAPLEVEISRCSVFTVSKGGQVFFGGNDDYINPDSYFWVDPGDEHNYGAIWIGRPDNVQQGVNERGLAYDANGLPRMDVNPHPERAPVPGGYTSYPIQILRESATVEEVIAWVKTHRWHSYMHDQLQFADATGDAVVISAGTDGELVFTRKPPGDGFLVSTNFNVANPTNGFGYPDWRYDRAQEMLQELVDRVGALTAEGAASVLDAVHVEGGFSWTISSMVADLPNGLVYLFLFHQFDRPVVLNVAQELANPRAPGPLSALFPADVRQEAEHRYQAIQARAGVCYWGGLTWLILVVGSLLLMVALPSGLQSERIFWAVAALPLGPLALLARISAGRCKPSSRWHGAFLEASGDVAPPTITFVVALVTLVFVPSVQGSEALQLGLVLGLPLAVSWLVFHGPLLGRLASVGYGRFLVQRLPHVLVVTNLCLGGISVVAIPLINLSVRNCALQPASILVWWAITVFGSLLGGGLIACYQRWTVGAGFQAWSVIVDGTGVVRTLTWRQLWWWILLSLVVLLCGVALGVVLNRILVG